MPLQSTHALLMAGLLAAAAAGCRQGTTGAQAQRTDAPAPVQIETAKAVEHPITRFLRVTGTLAAEEDAEVAAEIAGRIVATPVERGTPVPMGATLVRIAATEAEAQAQEAEANAAQIQARLGQPEGEAFDVDRVPEVASARATRDLAQAEFERARMLFERKLVSQSDFDQRRLQADNAVRQYESARNAAEQQRQALASARARVTLARKAVADTVVRAPFAGVVGERFVSIGDYVTKGAKVASVMRINPLRLELSVPAQYIAAVAVGRPVTLTVDSYPGRTFTGQVRYVSPGVRADSRSLVVEAIVANGSGELKPGLFATALIAAAAGTPGILIPAAAVQTVSGTARVFAVSGDHVEERIVTLGERVGDLVEVTTGLAAGDTIAASNLTRLSDGTRVTTGR